MKPGAVRWPPLSSRQSVSIRVSSRTWTALQLSNAERATLGEIGHRLGRKALPEVASVARPDTILAWYRKLIARKFDGSKARRSPVLADLGSAERLSS